jgi:hypothetical protein
MTRIGDRAWSCSDSTNVRPGFVKSGNAVILKGGKEAAASNTVLMGVFRKGLAAAGLPVDAVQVPSWTPFSLPSGSLRQLSSIYTVPFPFSPDSFRSRNAVSILCGCVTYET